MTPLRKFICLAPDERRLFVSSALALAAVRLALWTFPFRVVRYHVEQRCNAATPTPHNPGDIARAVRIASRFIPGASCLPQALTAQLLLRRSGYSPKLRLGVQRQADASNIKAHAWIELDGQILLGHLPDLPNYVPLPALT